MKSSSIFNHLGRINALVNCAGIAYLARITDGNPADWEEMWRVNVMALTLCCQLSLRHFPEAGRPHRQCLLHERPSRAAHRWFLLPTKFAVRAVTDSLRNELKAAGSSGPGLQCLARLRRHPAAGNQYFRGREDTLKGTRAHMKMLTPVDVAYCILSILEAPTHVEIGDIQLRSSDQPQ
ncbi:MAG: SDR family NAD(P)-dependent oxidoreductase [Luteolibacter sp.]